MKNTDRITAVILMGLAVFLLWETQKIEVLRYQLHSSRMFPQMVLIFILILASLLLFQTFFSREAGPAAQGADWSRLVRPRRIFLLVLLIIYLSLISSLGFLTSTAGFLLIGIIGLSPHPRKDLWPAVGVTAGVLGLVYLLFVYWLQVFLP
jgi:hypothetical protein